MCRVLCSLLLFISVVLHTAVAEKVCIIGSGMSASTTATFIRQLASEDSPEILIFEKEKEVGGRISSFTYKDHSIIEAGGSIIHSGNRYVMDLAASNGLQTLKSKEGDRRMGIFNGKEFLLQTWNQRFVDPLRMLWRYGLSLVKMQNFVDALLTKFDVIYEKQDQGVAYTSPVDLFKDVGLFNLTQTTLSEALSSAGMSPKLINELAAGINRVNYGQNTTLNAFAGAVGLARSGNKLRYIEGGNVQEQANATVFTSTPVKSITTGQNNDDSGGKRTYDLHFYKRPRETCDAVVIACPLELANIELPSELSTPLFKSRKFHLTQTTFVEGRLNESYFSQEAPPEIILTTEEEGDLVFNSIGLSYRDEDSEKSLYKVFSRAVLRDSDLNQIFIDPTIVKEYPWKAYPKFNPPEKFSPFLLKEGLIYVNAIESAASAMEVAAIGGRNAALLLQQHFNWRTKSNTFYGSRRRSTNEEL